MKSVRGERLASEFRKEIYAVISGKLKSRFPGLSAIISVTAADVAPDLKSAKIYLSIYDADKERAEYTYKTICENAGHIRSDLSKSMHIRTVPELRFIKDGSMEYGEKIDKILTDIHGNE